MISNDALIIFILTVMLKACIKRNCKFDFEKYQGNEQQHLNTYFFVVVYTAAYDDE